LKECNTLSSAKLLHSEIDALNNYVANANLLGGTFMSLKNSPASIHGIPTADSFSHYSRALLLAHFRLNDLQSIFNKVFYSCGPILAELFCNAVSYNRTQG
jgi:hypothetical protein